jgi:hypothetical protein
LFFYYYDRIRFFTDKNFQTELSKGGGLVTTLNYNQKNFIEVLVANSNETFKMFKNLDLRNAHLIINYFWLSFGNRNEQNEYFIEKG